MSSDAEYILGSLQRENSLMSNEIEYLRKEAARLLIERDESREICFRLAHSFDLWMNGEIEKGAILAILEEYNSRQQSQK